MCTAMRPRTSASYLAAFRQFIAFLVVTGLDIPYREPVIIIYLEYLIQQGLRSCTIIFLCLIGQQWPYLEERWPY